MNIKEKMWNWLNTTSCARCGFNEPKEDSDWCLDCRPEEEIRDDKSNILLGKESKSGLLISKIERSEVYEGRNEL